MTRLDALITVVAGSTLTGFVGLVAYALLTAVGLISTSGVSGADASGYGAGGVDAGGLLAAATFEPQHVTVDGEAASYLDFGHETPLAADGSVAVAPIWVFIDGFDPDGRPLMIPGHPSVLDVGPGDDGYSDLWNVEFVLVPEGFDSRSIRTFAALEASGLDTISSGMLVNCPIVEEGATTSEDHEARFGWYRDELVQYFILGVTTTTPGDVYEFVVDGVRLSSVPPLAASPPSNGLETQFFRLHEVEVTDASVAAGIRSLADLESSGLPVRSTDVLVNRPLLTD